MICNVKLNLYELKKFGGILEWLYNSKFNEVINYNSYKGINLDYTELVLDNDNNKYDMDSINKLMVLIDRVHKVNQKYLADANNKYKISVNFINVKKEILVIHGDQIDKLIYQINSSVLKKDNMDQLRKLKGQVEKIENSIETLDNIREKLMSRESIDIEEILNIDELC